MCIKHFTNAQTKEKLHFYRRAIINFQFSLIQVVNNTCLKVYTSAGVHTNAWNTKNRDKVKVQVKKG